MRRGCCQQPGTQARSRIISVLISILESTGRPLTRQLASRADCPPLQLPGGERGEMGRDKVDPRKADPTLTGICWGRIRKEENNLLVEWLG